MDREDSAAVTHPAQPGPARAVSARAGFPPDVIRSRDNKWLKSFRAALRGTGPERGEPIAVEGPKLVEEGFRARLRAEAILVSDSGEGELEPILRAARETETGIPRSRILHTTDKLFAGVAATETPQGVAALFGQPEWAFEDVLRGAPSPDGAYRADTPLVIVLVGVQDPGNVGTIVRSADAFASSGVIAARGTADPWSPKAVRASAGSALRLPLLRGIAVPVILAQLRVAAVRIYAASSRRERQNAAELGSAVNLRDPAAIFIGSEGHGLPPEVEHAADATISVPIAETVESLNAAVAASVVLYEAARQRKIRA
jgi:RNA methyltransferase, TrmH family